jgi:dipeptidase E
MDFLLTSAGLRNDAIKNALEELVGKSLSETKVLFVITAANTGHDDKRWLLENLNEFDRAGAASLDIIDIAGLAKEVWRPHFDAADVICVGGGDERYLARIFAEQNVKDELTTGFASKVYMGISAGSMVLGRYLPAELSKEIFVEEDFGNDAGEGMGLLPFAFIPHLNSKFFSLRKERLDGMQEKFTCQVYATDDETAVMVEDGKVTKVGDGEFLVYGT